MVQCKLLAPTLIGASCAILGWAIITQEREFSWGQTFTRGSNDIDRLSDGVEKEEPPRGVKSLPLFVITIETRPLNQTMLGLNRNGFKVEHVAEGYDWHGYLDKVRFLRRVMARVAKLDPDQLVLMLDTDLGIACNEKEIVERYRSISQDSGGLIVFSAESCVMGCNERCDEIPKVPKWVTTHDPQFKDVRQFMRLEDEGELDGPVHINSLNSGGIIAPAALMLRMYKKIIEVFEWGAGRDLPTDQHLYYYYWLNNTELVTLDYQMKIFSNLCDMDTDRLLDKRNDGSVMNNLSRRKACIIHFNAESKQNAESVSRIFGEETWKILEPVTEPDPVSSPGG
mmetsp:Transcript_17476/g.24403  ORF Transcript_17476/g.24403 Transcript_17476/m.24403 type:complete len:340 (-) Transcript_17476:99-1118(-)